MSYSFWGHYNPYAGQAKEEVPEIPERIRQAALGLIDAQYIHYDKKAKTFVVYGKRGTDVIRCFWDGSRFDSWWQADDIPMGAIKL